MKQFTILILLIIGFVFQVYAQKYNATSYANQTMGNFYAMPSDDITADTEVNIGGNIIDLRHFDIAGTTPDFNADNGVTFQLLTGNGGTDAGGMDIRGYDTKSMSTPTDYTAIRWNGGPQVWRQSGKWTRYTVDFQAGDYNFLYRARTTAAGVSDHKFVMRVLNINNLRDVVVEKTIDLSTNFPDVLSDANNVYRIGGGNDDSDWFRLLDKITIPNSGKYVLEIDEAFKANGWGFLGEVTFNEYKAHDSDDATVEIEPAKTGIINYDWASTIPESEFYDVKVIQGENEVDLFTHISKPNLKVGEDGHGVTRLFFDRSLSYTQFAFTDEITIEVTKKTGVNADRVEIQPKSYGINPIYFDGKTVRFKYKHKDNQAPYISVHFESSDNRDPNQNEHIAVKNGLVIFADRPQDNEPVKTSEGVTVYNADMTAEELEQAEFLYFPAGDHNLKNHFEDGVLRLTKNRQQIYLAGGAYVRGAIHGEGKDNIKVYGRGIMTGADYVWHEIRDKNGKKDAYMRFMGSDNCHFEGFIIENPCHHTIPSSKNTYHKNLKIIGWASNHDGIRPGGGSLSEQLFIKTSDDYDYARDPHKVKNSVIWPTRNGAFGMLGWNNLGTGYTEYEDIYFINGEWDVQITTKSNQGVIGSNLNQGVTLANNKLSDLYLEDFTSILANITIVYKDGLPLDTQKPGEIKNFHFENIKVETPFVNSAGHKLWQEIRGFEHNGVKATVHDITFTNLTAGGKLVTQDNHAEFFKIDENTTYNINFEVKGLIHTLRTTANQGGTIYPLKGDIHVADGTNQYVTIEPDEGYRIKNVSIDNQDIGYIQHIALSDVTADHLIEVEFEQGTNTFDLSTINNPMDYLADDIVLEGKDFVNEPKDDDDDDDDITSISEDITSPISVYPNPNNGTFQIDLSNTIDKWQVNILSVDGKVIFNQKVSNSTFKIENLNKGFYIVQAITSQGRYITKVEVK